eukprot:jgi/Psemu1/251889/estExt_Genewise1Plus.C_350140
MSIAVNFLTGPAMLQIPAMFQKSGLIPATLCIVFTCAFTTFGNLHFANAISKLPGNYEFTKEIEYSDAFERYWPDNKRWFRSTEIVFFLCITCLNVSSIVDSAQVLDVMLANVGCLGYKSHAIRCTTSSASVVLGLDCVHETWTLESCASDADCVPFSDHEDEGGILFTLGYALGVLFFMPLALMDLQENAFWQIIEFVVLIITTIMFSGLFLSQGIEWKGRLSLWGTNWNSLLGVVLFNFALPMSIPAWLYEKEQNVNAVKVISGSSITAAGLYIALGVLGAMSGPNIADNMLETFMSGGKGSAMQVTSFFFAVFIVGLGIPLLSVLGRLNLTGSGYSNFIGNVFAVYIPFGLSWLFYRGGLVTLLFAWGGILFTSLIAFLFPIFLSLRALDVSENPGAIFGQQDRQHQKRLLLCLLAVAIVAVSISIVGNLIPMAKRPNEPPDR